MMYRLLKDLINWKCNFYIKCKLGKLPNAVAVLLPCVLLVCVDLVSCSSLLNSSGEGGRDGRTLSNEHGIFRHDKPSWDTSKSQLPQSDSSDSSVHSQYSDKVNDNSNYYSSSSPSPPDSRDKYTYGRYKRSVTSLNFHPNKSRSYSDAVGADLKPMRIFKYITEDDVLHPSGPSHSETHHETIFHPFMKNESEKSNTDSNHSARVVVVGGAKVNLKAKFDKALNNKLKSNSENDAAIRHSSNNEATNLHEESVGDVDSEAVKVGSSSSHPKISPSPSKPENILIFKPSLAIRKKSNKTSLIPSGKYGKLNNPHRNQMSSVSGGGGSITAAISTKQTHPPPPPPPEEEESTDPNSSTVNDRSLIHNYFDSVVVLNEEEGQKQLRLQQEEAYREKTSNSDADDGHDNAVGSGGADDANDDEADEPQIRGNMPALHIPRPPTPPLPPHRLPAPSLSFTSVLSSSGGDGRNLITPQNEKIMSPSGPISPRRNNNTNANLVEKRVLIQTSKMNGTITGNKDKIIVKVVKKSKKSKLQSEPLDEDDGDQDGSERLRRSPFKVSGRFPPQPVAMRQIAGKSGPGGGHEQLAREALFRRNTAIMMTPRMRQLNMNSAVPRKVVVSPRIVTTGPSGPITRTIIPMQPIPIPVMQVPMVKKMDGPPKLTLIPSGAGPIGPGPVGPPLAAIKVIPSMQGKNVFMQPPPVTAPSAPPLQILPSKDLTSDASKTIYNFKKLPDDAILNHASSSYYSPTYRRFKNRFHDQISNIMESGKDLEDTVRQTWDESRPRGRHHHHHRHHHHPRSRSRSPGRQRNHRHHDHDSHHRYGRPRHGPNRSGAHSQHPHHRPPVARGKKLSNPKYTYPKNAENIQDILSYFEKDIPGPPPPRSRGRGEPVGKSGSHHGPMSPKRQQSSIPSADLPPGPVYPKLADLSGEFKDVHASLLKDIKEFAKRPNMFGSSSVQHDRHHQSSEPGNFFDPIDEIFNPQPKPVRDMIKKNQYDIKPDLYSLENIRERIAYKRGKLGGRHKDKNKSEQKDLHTFNMEHPPHTENDEDYYDSHRRHTSEGGFSGESTKMYSSRESDYDMQPSPYVKKSRHSKQDSSDDSHALYPSSHYKDSYDFSSGEYPSKAYISTTLGSPRKPVVLKRPRDDFVVKDTEPKKKPEHDYFWNSVGKGFEKAPTTLNLDSPLVLKSPQAPNLLQHFNPYTAFQNVKAVSAEDEDIVEIHTGNPAIQSTVVPSFTADSVHLKQEKLRKLYMDVLQQKLQLEAALLQPHSLSSALQSHLPSLHTSASLLPQHSPLQMPRVSVAPQLSAFSPTLAPLTGLSSLGATRRKKPMRMKIHIYPNGNDGIEQGLEAANLLAAGGFGTSGYSASNPPPSVVAPPPHDINKMSESAIPTGPTGPHPTGPHPTSPSGYGGPTAPMPTTVGSAVKNKNVVLHLHVHRRNDMIPLELETEGSSPIGATANAPPKLTYKEIYDEQMKSEHNQHQHQHQHHHNLDNHRMVAEEEREPSFVSLSTAPEASESEHHHLPPHHSHSHSHHRSHDHEEEDAEHDKSISMEAPIHDEKIEDVFHTLMKLRTNKPSSSVGLTGEDKRKKRNRN